MAHVGAIGIAGVEGVAEVSDCAGCVAVFDVVGLSVEEIGLADRADLDHAFDPRGAGLGCGSLGKSLGDGDAVFGQLEIRLSLFTPVDARNERGLAEKELEFRGTLEL